MYTHINKILSLRELHIHRTKINITLQYFLRKYKPCEIHQCYINYNV